MPKINLMARYPKVARSHLLHRSATAGEINITKAKKFDREYFDGSRDNGLGGYHYDPKFFSNVVKDFTTFYQLNGASSVLDIGCAKGFMLHDLALNVPGIKISGLDISKYCLENAISTVAPFLIEGCCSDLPYQDNSFDLVVSIATIHNLPKEGVILALNEIVRVTKKNAFIKVNGYENEEERQRLLGWNLVAETILHVDEWKELFERTGYIYDYDFFVP